jgi:hypothetical protein
MRKLLLTTTCIVLCSPAWAQTATGIGTGIGVAKSRSESNAVAISGQGGQGVGSVVVQGTQVPTATTATINNTGTSTVRNVPSVFSPGLAAAGLETCLGSVSGGGSFVGTGFSFGSTIPDPGCAARLDARTLWAMGLKKAAIARLCLNPEINRSMPEVCGTYLPQAQVAYTGYYLSAENYSGGQIMLVEGKTGQERLCDNYDAAKQRCRAWAGEPTRVVSHARKRVATNQAVTPTPAPASLAKPENTEGTVK